jgi:tetratricopeptide (TPR) repeat protein
VKPEYNKVTLFYRIPGNPIWNSTPMFQFDVHFTGGILLEKSVDLLEYYYVAETPAGEKIPFNSKDDPYEMIYNPMLLNEILLLDTNDFFHQVNEYSYFRGDAKITRQNQIPRIRAFLRKYPNSLDAWTQVGLAEYVSKHYDDAWTSLQIAHSLAKHYPFDHTHQFSVVMLYTLIKLYKTLGWLCEKYDNYEMGVVYATRLTQLDPHSTYAWYNLGDFKKKLHCPEEALEAYHQAVSVAPENLDSTYFYALYLVECNRPKKAQKYFQRLSELLKRNTPATRETKVCDMREIWTGIFTGFAKIADLNKKFKKARKYFIQASQTDPNNPFNNGDWGMFEYNQGNFTKAFELIQKSISIKETKPELFVVLGKLYLKRNQQRHAFETLMEAFKKGYLYPTLELLQKLDLKFHQIARLFPAQDQSLESLSHNLPDWQYLSQLYGKINDFENALRCCQIGLKRNPRNLDLLNQGAIYASKLFKLDEATHLNQEILEMQVQSSILSNKVEAVTLSNLGAVASKRGDVLAGIKYFEQARALDPENIEIPLYLARIYYMNQQFDKSLAIFQVVSNRVPSHMRPSKEYLHGNSRIAQIEYEKLWSPK